MKKKYKDNLNSDKIKECKNKKLIYFLNKVNVIYYKKMKKILPKLKINQR